MNPFLAEIKLFGFGFAPRGYAQCNGQLMAISQNAALFSLIGTNFGGNGATTFALPNLQGSLSVGQGSGPGLTDWYVGQVMGAETVVLNTLELPAHQHGLSATGDGALLDDPSGAQLANAMKGTIQDSTVGRLYSKGDPKAALNPGSMIPAGGGQPHENMMPYLAANYCIATSGTFPARN
jgi:microcystin-dependent protein